MAVGIVNEKCRHSLQYNSEISIIAGGASVWSTKEYDSFS
jgi:hypothetical protein